MSQKIPSDSAQKGFAVGRGLLAAAETLNYSMNEQRSDNLHGPSSRQLNSLGSGMGGGGEGQERDPQLSRRGGSHISNTMKLFASLGLSPTDLDALAQIPEDNISVETLPHLIMQLKNRKVESDRRMAGNPRDLSSLSPETSYRANREDWGDMRAGRLGGSMGQTSARAQQGDFGYNSMQDAPDRGYEFEYGHNNGSGGGRERQYSELSRDPYGGRGMDPSPSDGVFMQRRIGSPSQGKVQDFLGVMPHMFPHVCSLCDFDVHSTMEWNQHTNGLRHAENRRLLLQMYPDWDPHMASNRSSGSLLMETTNRSAGLLGPVPMANRQQSGGMSSNWGGGGGAGSNMSNKSQSHSAMPNKIRSRVVVAKYERKPLSNKGLFSLAQPFGTLCEHLVLKNKAFLEMETHKEALDMVHYYQQKPAVLYGKSVTFYLSKELLVIEKDSRGERPNREVKGQGSHVVFFSNMPRETERKMELLTIARRFGNVDKHLFLNDEAFVQMETPEDAEMLVKYYTLNPLTIRGRTIRLNICTKYKTLNVNRQRGGQGQGLVDHRARRQSSSAGGKASSKSTSSKSASASAKSKEDKKEEAKPAEVGVAAVEESGEEVAGVMEGDDDATAEDCGIDKGSGDAPEDPAEEEEEEAAAAEEEEVASADAPLESKEEEPAEEEQAEEEAPNGDADGEGAGKEAVVEVEAEAESAPAEAEATAEETETKDEAALPESSELTEEDLAEGQEGSMEQDFPENMDDFVTLDELAEDEDFERQESQPKHSDSGSGSSKKSGGLRVVNVVGFKRGYGFVNEILALAKPFGKVVQNLVLDVRPEAFLQLSSEEEAKAMVNFYSGNVQATVCGKPVKICHSQTYATIQSGRVVYVGQIPHCKYSDAALLKISEPFGKVRLYFLNRSRNECFIEMERGEDAERMAETYKDNPPKFLGKRLTVYVSRKYKQLKYGHRPPPPEAEEKRPSKRERAEEGASSSSGAPPKPAAKPDEEPPAKKIKEEKAPEAEEKPAEEMEEPVDAPKDQSVVAAKQDQTTDPPPESSDVNKMDTDAEVKPEEAETTNSAGVKSEDVPTVSSQSQAETKSSSGPAPLGPYEPNKPTGVEYVKMGYYCRVCFLFYSNEEVAKKVHCSSQAHYEKLKKHLEKEKAKVPSNPGKKSL